jgi:hypothetical protein
VSELMTAIFDSNRVWLFITTVLGGGVGLKIVESFLNRNMTNRGLRSDWLAEIQAQNARIDALEAEIESWRTKYYDQQVVIAKLEVQVVRLGGTVD